MTKIAQTLSKARDLVHNGWIQGASKKTGDLGECKYCLSGALLEADPWHGYAVTAVVTKAIVEVDHRYGGNIIAFNDAPGRTKEEVLKVLDRAIALA